MLVKSAVSQCAHLRAASLHRSEDPAGCGVLRTKKRLKVARQAGLSYKKAGVDVDAGAELVRRIQKLNPSIGGFSGFVPFGTYLPLAMLHNQTIAESSSSPKLCR